MMGSNNKNNKNNKNNNNTITAVIVDDEALARASLNEALKQFPDIRVMAECPNGFEAVKAVQQFKPQLLFLDVRMPRLDGFDVVELLGDDAPVVIFVTSYDEYALKAFEAEALDYILKPVKPERLGKSIQRVRQQLQTEPPQRLDTLVDRHREGQGPSTRILIRSGTEVVIIPVEDIIYFEAQDDYVKIHSTGKSHLKTERLSRLEKTLDNQLFCRIHRSYLINIDFLEKIEPYSKDNKLAILRNGAKLPISRSGYNRLMELL